jgi:hypothetical protein
LGWHWANIRLTPYNKKKEKKVFERERCIAKMKYTSEIFFHVMRENESAVGNGSRAKKVPVSRQTLAKLLNVSSSSVLKEDINWLAKQGALTKLGGHSVTLSNENLNTLVPKISKNWNSNDWARFEQLESPLPFTPSRSLEGNASAAVAAAGALGIKKYLLPRKFATLQMNTIDNDQLKNIIGAFVNDKDFQEDARVYLQCECKFDDKGKFTGPNPQCEKTCEDIRENVTNFKDQKTFKATLDIKPTGEGPFNEEMLKMFVRSELEKIGPNEEKLTVEAVFEKLDRENGPMTTFLTAIQKMNTSYWNLILNNLFATCVMMLFNLQNPFWHLLISENPSSMLWKNDLGVDGYGITFIVMCIIWIMFKMIGLREEARATLTIQ